MDVAKSFVISVVCVRSRLSVREHLSRQIEHDPHRRNYRPVQRGRLRITRQKVKFDVAQLSSLPILSSLLPSDALPRLGHRALHQEHEEHEPQAQDGEQPEDVEAATRGATKVT